MASYENELLSITVVTDQEWQQDYKEAIQVVGKELGVWLMLTAFNRNAATTTIRLATNVKKAEEGWCDVGTVKAIDADITEFPACFWAYFAGPGVGGTGQPGVANYVKLAVSQAAGASITLSAVAVMKD